MAKLTWDAVSAPNFGNPVDGIRTAAELFGRATASAKEGIDQFIAQRNQAAERAIMQRALAVSDPAQLAKMQADGSLLGSEGQYASVDLLDKLSDRQGDLVTLANNQEVLKGNQYKNKRTAETDANQDASRGAVFELFARANANDTKGVSEILANNPELAQLDLTTLGNLFKDTTNIQNTANSMANDNTKTRYEGERLGLDKKRTESLLATNELQRKVSKYNLERAGIEDGREDNAFEDNQAAQEIYTDAIPRLLDNQSALELLTDLRERGVSPNVTNQVQKLLKENGFNPTGPIDPKEGFVGNMDDTLVNTLTQLKGLQAEIAAGNASRQVPLSAERLTRDANRTDATPAQIAAEAASKDGPFPDTDVAALTEEITTIIQNNPKLNAAQALAALELNTQKDWEFSVSNFGEYDVLDDELNKTINSLTTKKMLEQAQANDISKGELAKIENAIKRLEAANGRVSFIEAENRRRGGIDPMGPDDQRGPLADRVLAEQYRYNSALIEAQRVQEEARKIRALFGTNPQK